jgi:hypothetical protein
VSRLVSLIALVSLLLAAPARAQAAEYTLQVADLIEDAFVHFMRGDVGRGEGEMALTALERALDRREMNRGGLLYDRDVHPAGEGVARSFGAVAVRPTSYSSSEDKGFWKTVRWEGKPGDRVVWIVRPATMHYAHAKRLGLGGTTPGLRYYIPYGVTLSPTPARAVAYSLTLLRSGEGGADLWDRYLSRSVDLTEGLAAVVGVNSVGGDWVYLVVQQPSEPVTFRVAIGWDRRGANDRVIAGTGGTGIRVR